ncbi:MAG: O-methyltransferase [Halanaerobiales bacterium]
MNDSNILKPERDESLLRLENEARKAYIPIVKPEVGQFLSVMVRACKPVRILEIGTAIGYSTIWMARASAANTEIVTIEIKEEMYRQAAENFKKFGLDQQINQKLGDALEILPCLRREFDFVFIDAAKSQYLNYLEMILELLPSGGVIIADNILYRGYVEKEGPIKRKRRAMVNTLKDYIDVVKEHELLETSILSIGDGIAISVRK